MPENTCAHRRSGHDLARETTPPAVTVALPPSTITKTVIPVPTLPLNR